MHRNKIHMSTRMLFHGNGSINSFPLLAQCDFFHDHAVTKKTSLCINNRKRTIWLMTQVLTLVLYLGMSNVPMLSIPSWLPLNSLSDYFLFWPIFHFILENRLIQYFTPFLLYVSLFTFDSFIKRLSKNHFKINGFGEVQVKNCRLSVDFCPEIETIMSHIRK